MRVVLVDSCPVFREGLKSIMAEIQHLKVVAEADSYGDVFEKIRCECDLLIMDGELEALALLRALDKANRTNRPPFVLILSGHNDDHHAIQMLSAGADGYLIKSGPPQSILDAILKVSRGAKYIGAELAEILLLNVNRTNKSPRLSDREYEVLYLLASGLAATEIAAQLSLSVKTVSTYRSRLLDKLHLRSNADLMRYAYKEGIMT